MERECKWNQKKMMPKWNENLNNEISKRNLKWIRDQGSRGRGFLPNEIVNAKIFQNQMKWKLKSVRMKGKWNENWNTEMWKWMCNNQIAVTLMQSNKYIKTMNKNGWSFFLHVKSWRHSSSPHLPYPNRHCSKCGELHNAPKFAMTPLIPLLQMEMMMCKLVNKLVMATYLLPNSILNPKRNQPYRLWTWPRFQKEAEWVRY